MPRFSLGANEWGVVPSFPEETVMFTHLKQQLLLDEEGGRGGLLDLCARGPVVGMR